MEKESLQETAQRLKNFQGNVKGDIFVSHKNYIKEKEGEKGVEKVEKKMKELGVEIDFEEIINSLDWVNEGKASLVPVVAKEIFGWTDEDIFDMGRRSTRNSFIMKILLKYLVSVETMFKNVGNYWDKHLDFGSLEAVKFDKKKQEIILREKGYKTHPLICIYHAGFFKGMMEFVLKDKKVTVEETACVFEGADYNEYLIKWQ